MEDTRSLDKVPDDELLRRLSELLSHSRRVEADLIAHIGEVDARRLYAREGSPSMYAYCTQVLHLSEFEAYLRITVARAAREHPLLLAMLREGSLHLSAVAKLAPHLTPENRETLLARAAHRSKREVEELITEIAPRPDTVTVVRRLPDRGVAFDPDAQLGLDRVEPPRLKHANATVGHVGPMPAARRAVYERDGGRCRFVDDQGRRCTATGVLEFHHRHPFGHGGEHSLRNVALACNAHNRFLAEVDYGRGAMERHVTSAASPHRGSRAARAERPGPSDAPTAPWPRSAPAG